MWEDSWKALVDEYAPLIDSTYIELRTGKLWVFIGLIYGSDDYYFGMVCDGKLKQLSCVGGLTKDSWGFELVKPAAETFP